MTRGSQEHLDGVAVPRIVIDDADRVFTAHHLLSLLR